MATWTLTGTGLPIFAIGSNLVGDIQLAGTPPGDWNPDGVTEVRIIRVLEVGGMTDDWVDDHRSAAFRNFSGSAVATITGSTVTRVNGVHQITMTDTSPSATVSDSGNYVSGNVIAGGTWASYVANMKNDNGTVQITAVTVEIDYTPLVLEAPTVTISSANPTTVLIGENVSMQADFTGVPEPSLVWDYGVDGSFVTGGNFAGYEQRTATWSSAGVKTVTVTATNSEGSAQDTVQITVNAPASPLFETLEDDFSGGLGKWPVTWGTAAISGSRLELPEPSSGVHTNTNKYDLTTSYLFARFVPPNGGQTTEVTILEARETEDDKVGIQIYNGLVRFIEVNAAAQSVHGTVAYDPVAHRMLGIRCTGGQTVEWIASKDGTSWSVLHTRDVAVTLTAMYAALAGTALQAGSVAAFDSVNLLSIAEADIWNGAAWVGAEAWNGVAWVTPEVWNGTEWIPFKAPPAPSLPATSGEWLFSEGSGTTIGDSSGNGHDFSSLPAGASWAPGGGLTFSTTATPATAAGVVTASSDDVSISVWFRVAADQGAQFNSGFPVQAGSVGVVIGAWDTHIKVGGAYDSDTPDGRNFDYVASQVPFDEWHHLTVRPSDSFGASGTLDVYLDGVFVSAVSILSPGTPHANGTVYLGQPPAGATAYDITLDDVRVYDYLLTAAEIADVFAAGRA